MQAWQARPLDEACAAVFTGAIVVKVRDGQGRQPAGYAAIGVTLAGDKPSWGCGPALAGRAPSSG
jgi:transposase-like protein